MDTDDLSILEAEASNENTSPQRLEELAQISPELARRVAQNPCTPSGLLRVLSQSNDSIIGAAVTANPNTPTEVLLRLVAQFPEAFLDNPVVPLLCLEQPDFLQSLTFNTVLSLFQCEKAPTSLLDLVSVRTRELLARGEFSINLNFLEKLAHDDEITVRGNNCTCISR